MTEDDMKAFFIGCTLLGFIACAASLCVGGCIEKGLSNARWEAEAVKRGAAHWDVDAENNRRFQWRTTDRKADE